MNKMMPESDPRRHTANLRRMLGEVAGHAREDVSKVSDPKAQALFETAAEVLLALQKACEQFERKTEAAWK